MLKILPSGEQTAWSEKNKYTKPQLTKLHCQTAPNYDEQYG